MNLALSWSGGKDSALALQALRAAGTEPAALLTTVDEATQTVPHHDVPLALVVRQAEAAGIPLVTVDIPTGAPNADYEAQMRQAFAGPLAALDGVAFGDLFLEDLRAYRERRMREVEKAAIFPLWGSDTTALARRFIADGFRATVVAPRELRGRPFGAALLAALPDTADPCGENGEFHTFVTDGPVFARRIPFDP